MKINGLLIPNEKLLEFFSYIEDDVLKQKFFENNRLKKIFSTILGIQSLIAHGIMGFLILNISQKFIILNSINISVILIVLTVNEVIRSYILNKHFFFLLDSFNLEITLPLVEKLIAIYPKEKRSELLEFQDVYKSYQKVTYTVVDDGIPLLINFIILTILVYIHPNYYFMLVGLILLFIILAYSGYKFSIAYARYYLLKKKNETVDKKTMNERTWYPLAYNYVNTLLLPISVILFLSFNVIQLVPFITYTISTLSFVWAIFKNLDSIFLANSIVNRISNELEEISSRYIFNTKTYTKQTYITHPSNKILLKSKKDHSLIVKDFIPMYPSNSNKPSHIYNFEFKPGMYQLNGHNGVGKTTFLKSLTLPKNYQTEYSTGEVALNGSPLFERDISLVKYRNRFKYIGHISEIPDFNKIKVKDLSGYPLIQNIILQIQKEKHATLSEGEQALVSLSKYYIDLKKGITHNILIIDEVFSRIYNGKENRVRDQAIQLLKDMRKLNRDLIVLIVDHMTKVTGAKQLQFSKKEILPL